MSALNLARIFQGRRIPEWLRRFEEEPDGALQDLLLGRAFLGHLNADEPLEVLLDWLQSLGPRSSFAEEIDAALARWIRHSWGQATLPLPGATAAVLAAAWCRAADLVAFEPNLGQSARAFRGVLPQERAFLASLSEGRSRDPEGRAWLALARHQENRSLLDLWWRLCSLPPDVPWYHGFYGIHGLRELPPEKPERAGTFPSEVAEGLARLSEALAGRAEEGWLSSKTAREEFQRIAELTMAAYPGARWPSFWRHALQKKRVRDEQARGWIQDLFPRELRKEIRPAPGARARWAEPDPYWRHRAREIAEKLANGDWTFLDKARQLLREESLFASETGDSYDIVRSACQFAAKVRKSRPELALKWAMLARSFDPWNDHAWNISVATLLTLGRTDEALRMAVGAAQRFPHDVVARTGLAEVLRAQGRYEESERLYRETVTEFSGDVVARTSLAEVLRAQGRYEESEKLYRETVKKFSENVVARTGLAEVLRAQERYEESESLYRETVKKFPDNVVARGGLATVLREQGKEVEPWLLDPAPKETEIQPEEFSAGKFEEDFAESTEAAPPSEVAEPRELYVAAPAPLRSTDVEILLQDAYLLRRWAGSAASLAGLREKARRILERLIASNVGDSEALGGLALVEIEQGDLDQALHLLREASKRFPGSARVRYALARAERAAAERRKHMDNTRPEAPALPWRALARLDERFKPLHLLGEGRTWLVQVDGNVRAAHAKNCLGQLGWWLREQERDSPDSRAREDSSAFVRWWADEVQKHVFGGHRVSSHEDLGDLGPIEERIEVHSTLLNHLEEDWVGHWARA